MTEKDVDAITEALQQNIEDIDEEIKTLIDERDPINKNNNATEEEKHSSSPDESEKEKDKDEDGKKRNNTAAVIAGISKAYADDEMMKMPPQEKLEKNSSSWPKPPKRNKSDIKVAKGENIMEVFWNEMWALYDKVLDLVVDTTLDFVEFVLYPEKPAISTKNVKTADAFVAGEAVCKEEYEKVDKIVARAIAEHKEISDNLQRTINGEDTEWKITREPGKFSKLVEAKKKAMEDPNSPEGEYIREFEKMPEVFNKMGKNCKKMIGISVHLATMEEYIHPTTEKEAIKEAKEQYKNNPTELKKKLEEIEATYKDPKKQQEKMKERIKGNYSEHYNTIMANISKIRNANENDPQKIQEELKEYMTPIKEAFTDARDLIYKKMYQEGKDGKTLRKKASEKIKTTVDTLNHMQINNDNTASNENINGQNYSPDKVISLIKNSYGIGR